MSRKRKLEIPPLVDSGDPVTMMSVRSGLLIQREVQVCVSFPVNHLLLKIFFT